MPQWDRIDVDGSPMRLYVGMPSLGRAFPAVIVIQHGPGVDRFIEDRVETLSQQGYLAIAPDLYHRQPEDGDMMTRIGRLRDPEVISDVNAAVNYARRLKDTQLGDVGIIGFCMGGRVAYLMAASKPVVSFVGSAPGLTHQETGWLVPDGDIDGFARGALTLLDDHEMARRLGRNARRFVEAEHSWATSAELCEEIYCRLLAARR